MPDNTTTHPPLTWTRVADLLHSVTTVRVRVLGTDFDARITKAEALRLLRKSNGQLVLHLMEDRETVYIEPAGT